VTVTCRICNQEIPVSATEEQLMSWHAGALIQYAMPGVPADERELLISGICGPCFDRMFPEE